MISKTQPKLYCKEDIRLIPNYEIAVSSEEKFHCHHILETDGYSKSELIEKGLYYNRPASELIFLSQKEHAKLHMTGKPSWWKAEEKCLKKAKEFE